MATTSAYISSRVEEDRESASSSKPALPTLSQPTTSTKGRALLSRSDIANRIISGQHIFIYRSLAINATAWLPYHPGGNLSILHFVGRDATDEVEAYHSVSALERMKKYAIGQVEINENTGWKALTPPISLGLVRHPDGVKGHWTKEGSITLATEVLGQSSTGKAVSAVSTSSSPTSDVVTLTADQLEPLMSELSNEKEYAKSKAYHELKTRISEAGLFDRPGPLAGYGMDLLRYSTLAGLGFGCFFL